MKRRTILIIGGTNVMVARDGHFFAKSQFVDYLNEMATVFDGCTWVAPIETQKIPNLGRIAHENIKVVPVRLNPLQLFYTYAHIAGCLIKRPYVAMFHASYLLPLLPIVAFLSKNFVAYLGLDFRVPLNSNLLARYPGWKTFFRIGHEMPLRLADAVLARGKFLAELARCYNQSVYLTIPLGQVRPSNLTRSARFDSNAFNLLFVGKVTKEKGLDCLIEAFRRLVQQRPDVSWHLDIVGEGKDRFAYEEYVDRRQIKNLMFHGWLNFDPDIEILFSKAHVFICPSIYPEGVPRVIDEALIRRVPVIATKVGGIAHEAENDEILLVEPNDAEQLAMAVESVLFDSKKRSSLVKGAERRVAGWRRYQSAAHQHIDILIGT